MLEQQDAPAITLWGAGTTRTLRPIWVAEELDIKYALNPIGPRTGETLTTEYTQLNPKQKIPFFKDKHIQLSESVAICRYLIRRYGNAATMESPQDIDQQAREEEWLNYIYGELDESALYVIRRHGALSQVYGEAPVAIEAAEKYAIRHLKVIERHLTGKQYLLNERFTLSDLFLMTCLDWVHTYDIPMPQTLQEYRKRIASRPAYQKASAINKPG
ncbi:MAG: glutathione S-transferase family protein [Pseudomonadales bacterium]|nr:glutathione S-transferase family protein [Pseudomonadales bacterium]